MKPANPRNLTINGGSSSIKFVPYQTGEPLNRRLYGAVDPIGMSGTNLTFRDPTGKLDNGPSIAAGGLFAERGAILL